ncbi:DUF6916 family protein [Dokdonella sp.]|uniref:DUF6916 family protein n=1 Tax=Dokdonella sp. TaxID=2291710 RepID=UPI003782EF32
MPASMRHEDFSALLGRACRVRSLDREGGAVELVGTLAEVGERRERQGYEQFALLFKVEEPGVPQQGSYAVEFDGEDAREIFLVPVAREGLRIAYEAVFNRAVGAA